MFYILMKRFLNKYKITSTVISPGIEPKYQAEPAEMSELWRNMNIKNNKSYEINLLTCIRKNARYHDSTHTFFLSLELQVHECVHVAW